MSARHRHLASWTTVRGQSDLSSFETTACCANCGRPTADTVIGESLSVVALDLGRRLAPPVPLCETCRRDVIYQRGWLPVWCTACQDWRPFGHDHTLFIEPSRAVFVA